MHVWYANRPEGSESHGSACSYRRLLIPCGFWGLNLGPLKKATSALNCLAMDTVSWHYNFDKHFQLYEEVVLSNDTTINTSQYFRDMSLF